MTGGTGAVYWWMKHMMTPSDPWAAINHPLQPWMLKAHILAAPVLVFALGLVAGEHIWARFRAGIRRGRRSGLLAMGALVPMVLSGYLIPTVTAPLWLGVLGWIHVGSGVAYVAGMVAHLQRFRVISFSPERRHGVQVRGPAGG